MLMANKNVYNQIGQWVYLILIFNFLLKEDSKVFFTCVIRRLKAQEDELSNIIRENKNSGSLWRTFIHFRRTH